MPLSTEKDIEKRLVSGVEELGGECLKLEVKGRNGWPDRLCILPEGIVVFVEVKKPSGVLSAAQRQRLLRLEELSHLHEVVWDAYSVDVLLFAFQHMIDGKKRAAALKKYKPFRGEKS